MLRFLPVILISAFISIQSCNGQYVSPRVSLTRERKDSLMLRIPEARGFISDFDNVFTPEQEDSLDSLLRSYEKATGVEIAIVTITGEMVSDRDFDDFTLVMANL